MPAYISIILATRNMAHFLPGAIQSILDNSFQDVELIVIDDGSSDNTRDIVTGFKEKSAIPIYFYSVSHRGKATCLNEIFSKIEVWGEYIVFMDTDDRVPPDSLQDRYDAIISAKADLVIGEFNVVTRKGKVLDHRKLRKNVTCRRLINTFFYAPKSPLHLNACIIKKDLLLQTGRFDETLRRGQDVDYIIRLLKNAEEVAILPEVVYHYQKYYRPLRTRIVLRLTTMRCRLLTLRKHLSAVKLITAALLHMVYDTAKLMYEVLMNDE